MKDHCLAEEEEKLKPLKTGENGEDQNLTKLIESMVKHELASKRKESVEEKKNEETNK